MTTIHLTDDNFPGKFDPVGDWHDLDQPCDTCGGTGSRYYGALKDKPRCPNPDCVGGRRVVWEFCHGPVEPPLQLDHLCNVPRCCNPSHLEPVTPKENTRRSHERRRAARA